MSEALRVLGMRLLSGRIGGIYAARAERVQQLMGALYGSEAPAIPALPEVRAAAGPAPLARMRLSAKHRPKALAAATRVLEAILTRSPVRVAAVAHPQLWVLWPSGQVAQHERELLLEHLARRGGEPGALELSHVAGYAPGELRNALPRGVPEAVELALTAPGALWVCASLDSSSGTRARVMLLMSADREGVWRAHNLLMPAMDHAFRASHGASAHEEAAVRAAEQVLRHWVLGHATQLRSLRNAMLDRVLLGDAVEAAEKIAEQAAEGLERVGESETVFLGSERVGVEALPAPARERLKRQAKELTGRAYEKLSLRVVRSTRGVLDESRGEPANVRPMFAVMIGVRDKKDAPLRFRVGALFF